MWQITDFVYSYDQPELIIPYTSMVILKRILDTELYKIKSS